MESLFRKSFWVVELAFLALSSVLAATAVNGTLAARLQGPVHPREQAPSRAAGGPALGRNAALDLERTARLLGIELPADEPESVPTKPAYDPNAPPVKSSLRLTLIGTMVANRPEWSFSTIRDENTKEPSVYLVGDTVLGAEILEIERLRVILLNEGRKEFISVDGPGAAAPSMPVSTTPAFRSSPSGPVAEAEIKEVGEGNFEISRDDVEKQLSNLNAIATQARIVPSFKNGEANGFKIFSIRPGSIYQKLGMQNGDVIKKINGYEINSPDKALEIYSKLKEASRIDVELERRGANVNRTVNVR